MGRGMADFQMVRRAFVGNIRPAEEVTAATDAIDRFQDDAYTCETRSLAEVPIQTGIVREGRPGTYEGEACIRRYCAFG